jgi:FMN phosphatase YigB (HAD superfamily)
VSAHQPNSSVVFLLDCDNTLLDNDALKVDLAARLRATLGETLAARFWDHYEAVRRLEDGVDLPATFALLRADCPDERVLDAARATVMDYPFAERLFPMALATLAHLATLGLPVILSDGDPVYQPRKIERSGLAAAVGGRVAVYQHKEEHLDEVFARWPAPFYVVVDDKPRILAALTARYPDRMVSVQMLHGHYARDAEATATLAPDFTFADIGDLRALTLDQLVAAPRRR